jgi:hypothetical protein
MTLAPYWASLAIVGWTARIRPSSVMVVPSSGTLRSARTKTRLPATPSAVRSSIVFIRSDSVALVSHGSGPVRRIIASYEPRPHISVPEGAGNAAGGPGITSADDQSWPPTKVVRSTRRLE